MPTTFPLQLKRVLPSLMLLLGLAVLSFTSGTAQAASATRPHTSPSGRSSSASAFTCGTWNVVASPNGSLNINLLSDVAAVSASNVWAVGYYINFSTNVNQTLIEFYC